jgi:uncharacterized membrane protein
VAVAAVVLFGVLAAGGVVVATHVAFEQSVNQAVGETLDEPRYEELGLVVVRAEFDGRPLLSVVDEQQVTVVVTRDADRQYPALSDELARRIETQTGRQVSVVVQFVERQTASDRVIGLSRDTSPKHDKTVGPVTRP